MDITQVGASRRPGEIVTLRLKTHANYCCCAGVAIWQEFSARFALLALALLSFFRRLLQACKYDQTDRYQNASPLFLVHALAGLLVFSRPLRAIAIFQLN